MVLKISPSPKQSIAPSTCGMGVSPESVYSPSRRHTPPFSLNLMQPSAPIARKMLSKGFGK
ncbi:hypothetical protein QUA81_07010 [Microcoleus sp. F6_B4]